MFFFDLSHIYLCFEALFSSCSFLLLLLLHKSCFFPSAILLFSVVKSDLISSYFSFLVFPFSSALRLRYFKLFFVVSNLYLTYAVAARASLKLLLFNLHLTSNPIQNAFINLDCRLPCEHGSLAPNQLKGIEICTSQTPF